MLQTVTPPTSRVTSPHARPRAVYCRSGAFPTVATEIVGGNEDLVDAEMFISAARHLGQGIYGPARDAAVEFKARSHPSGALLIRGVPIGQLPRTPETPIAVTTKDRTSELSLLAVASMFGEPVGYLPELGGRVVQNLLPVKANATRQTSTSSNVTLAWHTETAFHPHKPRYLLLLCLRGDPSAQTLLCSIDAIMETLNDETIAVLRQPRFRIAPDESFLRPGQTGHLSEPLAVLTGEGNALTLTFDADLMVGMDPEATETLREVSARIDRFHIGVVLETGDLLVVDNNRAVHGRSPFKARFDGTDRWLQRTFVVNDLEASAHDRRDRIITTAF